MRKKSRIDIIEYCKKCQHVQKDNGTTICGLTRRVATFDYDCSKFLSIEADTPWGRARHAEKEIAQGFDIPFWPMIVGVILFIVMLLPLKMGIEPGLRFLAAAVVSLMMRGVALWITYTLTEKFLVKKTWWMIAAFLFCGWELIVLNVYLVITRGKD